MHVPGSLSKVSSSPGLYEILAQMRGMSMSIDRFLKTQVMEVDVEAMIATVHRREVTPNRGFLESGNPPRKKNLLNSGVGIIVIWPDLVIFSFKNRSFSGVYQTPGGLRSVSLHFKHASTYLWS